MRKTYTYKFLLAVSSYLTLLETKDVFDEGRCWTTAVESVSDMLMSKSDMFMSMSVMFMSMSDMFMSIGLCLICLCL
jgi:hypothetical protein